MSNRYDSNTKIKKQFNFFSRKPIDSFVTLVCIYITIQTNTSIIIKRLGNSILYRYFKRIYGLSILKMIFEEIIIIQKNGKLTIV